MTLEFRIRDTRLRTDDHTCGAPKPAAHRILVAEMTALVTRALPGPAGKWSPSRRAAPCDPRQGVRATSARRDSHRARSTVSRARRADSLGCRQRPPRFAVGRWEPRI